MVSISGIGWVRNISANRTGIQPFVFIPPPSTSIGCIENSNMLKSLEPNTTHGTELGQLFCFDFDRPNCLGPDLAARLLMSYGEEFVTKYEKRRKQVDPLLRWAAFLHFIDTHEDTMVMSSILDPEMSSFLRRLADLEMFENTLLILTSDHGLHYGPYFQSRSGRREATEPLLYIRVPPIIQTQNGMETFKRNAAMWTTAFDVHETMLSLSIPSKEIGGLRKGSSLFNPLPEERKCCSGTPEIPSEYCFSGGSFISAENDLAHSCTKMPRPPSIQSFYSDFSTSKINRFSMDCMLMENKTASQVSFDTRCHCATSHREWFRCGEHPWGPEEVRSKRHPQEYFALVDCHGQKIAVDTRVLPGGEMLGRIRQRQLVLSPRAPNVLFIQVNSVGIPSADRYLPKTRTFLKQYKIRQTSHGQFECNDGICAPDFNLFSMNGPTSNANQVRGSARVFSRFQLL
jgi:hypothetical protein